MSCRILAEYIRLTKVLDIEATPEGLKAFKREYGTEILNKYGIKGE